jgi:hypothetical protein
MAPVSTDRTFMTSPLGSVVQRRGLQVPLRARCRLPVACESVVRRRLDLSRHNGDRCKIRFDFGAQFGGRHAASLRTSARGETCMKKPLRRPAHGPAAGGSMNNPSRQTDA